MCKRIWNVFVVALVMFGTAVALAKNTSRSSSGALPSGETLALTHAEKKMVWRDLSGRAIHYYGGPWFEGNQPLGAPQTLSKRSRLSGAPSAMYRRSHLMILPS